jgi:CubicO group peptidase (beta-lactamase class C family)
MISPLLRRLAVLLFVALPFARAQDSDPTGDWKTITPAAANYSAARLEVLRSWLKTQPTAAMMVVVHGQILFQYGDVTLNSKIASVRKSILSMLYGPYVASGKIDLNKTVKELNLEDGQPFLPIEENARLIHLLTARSGIYLPSGNKSLDALEPRRGSLSPGTSWAYNNWDFNAAGTAFERLTGKNIYDALESDLARPLGFQDFNRKLQNKIPAPPSIHPEFAMSLSTRDMARLGLLMLHNGKWNGKQLISTDWCGWTTSVSTHWQDLNPVGWKNPGQPDRWGYGMLWWTWDTGAYPGDWYVGPWQSAYTAMGTGGQYITVFPQLDMVVVHKVDIDRDPNANVTVMAYDAILSMLVDSRCATACKE